MFAIVVLDLKYEAFIVYIAALSFDLGNKMFPLKKAQIAYLKANEASIKVFNEYANFAKIFSPKLAIELPKYTINNPGIELVDN